MTQLPSKAFFAAFYDTTSSKILNSSNKNISLTFFSWCIDEIVSLFVLIVLPTKQAIKFFVNSAENMNILGEISTCVNEDMSA